MSHLKNIGFQVNDKEEFKNLMVYAFKKGKKFQTSKGIYSRFRDESGAELWTKATFSNELIGMTPYYHTALIQNVILINKESYSNSYLDGYYECLAAPSDLYDPKTALFPFLFESPDFWRNQPSTLPIPYTIEVIFSPTEIHAYATKLDYINSVPKDQPLNLRAFLPLGYVEDDPDLKTYAIVTGIVKSIEEKRNQTTRNPFLLLRIDTLGMEVEIPVSQEKVKGELKAEGVIKGTFWVLGRVLHPVF